MPRRRVRKAPFSLREKYGNLAVEYIHWKDYIETVKKKGSKKNSKRQKLSNSEKANTEVRKGNGK